jgi:hypothetical protein
MQTKTTSPPVPALRLVLLTNLLAEACLLLCYSLPARVFLLVRHRHCQSRQQCHGCCDKWRGGQSVEKMLGQGDQPASLARLEDACAAARASTVRRGRYRATRLET